MLSFFIYFISPKNTIYSHILDFPLIIKYKNNLRILQANEKANCTKVEPYNIEFNKYYCSVITKTSNFENIELSTHFNFKPKTTFESFFSSSLVNMNLDNFKNITSKAYISPEVFILDNSTAYKYNNTYFEIKGIIEKSNPKFGETAQLLIENNLSEKDKFKKLECSISKDKNNNYCLICLTNVNVEFQLQGSIALTGDNLILINLERESEKITFNNLEGNYDSYPSNYNKDKKSSNKWIIVVIIVSIVLLLIVLAVIFFVFRKRKEKPHPHSHAGEETASDININQLN